MKHLCQRSYRLGAAAGAACHWKPWRGQPRVRLALVLPWLLPRCAHRGPSAAPPSLESLRTEFLQAELPSRHKLGQLHSKCGRILLVFGRIGGAGCYRTLRRSRFPAMKLMAWGARGVPDCLIPVRRQWGLCMNEAFRTLVAVAMASTAGGAMCFAQTPPALDVGPRPPVVRPPVTGPAIAGTWSGTALLVQQSIEYTVTLEITPRGAEINYPDLHCGGRLSRIGASRDYAFFVETITRGPPGDDARCSNGSITMARAGDDLVWGWFGLVKGEISTAHARLTRQSDSNQQAPAAEAGAEGPEGPEGPSVTATPRPAPPPVPKRPPAPVAAAGAEGPSGTATPGSTPPPVRKPRPPAPVAAAGAGGPSGMATPGSTAPPVRKPRPPAPAGVVHAAGSITATPGPTPPPVRKQPPPARPLLPPTNGTPPTPQ